MNMIKYDQNLTMSSREIAELTGSRHDNVKISMERMKNSGVIGFTAMQENPRAQGGRPLTVYNVNKRDSYIVVAQLSPEFTARLVDRWQELEEANQFKIPQTLPEALLLAAELAKQNEEAQKQLAIAAPKVDFADRIASAGKGVPLGGFAKAVGLGPKKIFEILRQIKVLMTGGQRHNLPFQELIDRGYFQVKQGTYEANGETRISHTPLITGKGEQWLIRKLISCGILKATAA
ncbi:MULTISPECIES: phage antirepressor KilAC domain-containing protein [unclassified Vibrio]|uniref:phage antirepressor KilAC domain-containing protein n=1 Tax=unclassified Vibrio TaxID=2614977 RepID=UPI000B8EE375|nr:MULTISPECIES: phage antirepressor KilAC domain-containing protein [unclassified Vibrio]NAX42669.1 DNA-binding protein [Vibrio sp. V25_P4S6T154]OXX40947.1 DNA-binding protein [Vibrio sp. V17_P4S1T151]OXX59201.1 DNA-binding protein [Vibrio sp. V15_P4S5T153]OXX65441.1 DNA-binding protein [Vibrio sp. V20_P4S3T152]